MLTIFKFLCRIIPAITFIFSGLVKAIDPVGGAIKFEDYFVAFHLDMLIPIALPLAIVLASVEFLLGFYLLLGFYVMRLSSVALLIMSFFTILALFLAIFNPVSDCGCFGDALKLSNWETFWKNIVIVSFTIGLFLFRKSFTNKTGKIQIAYTGIALAAYIIMLNIWSINNLPVIDFRPFNIGTHIASQMEIPEGAEQPEFETLFILEKDGQRKTFTENDYPYDDTTWVFIDTETKNIKEGFQPPLYDFNLMNPNLDEETQRIVNHQGPLFLMISPRIEEIDQQSILPLAELAELARENEIPFYCVTASGSDVTMDFDLKNKTMFQFLNSDEITLKTMIRSNPGLILLYDGTIAGKWHYRNIPDKTIIKNPLPYSLANHNKKNVHLLIWANLLGLILIPSLIINSKTINKRK